jgi:F-type H+-transporting ATPase subunit gamma
MANLKEIRNRITSVGSTMQITSAMKMVSAAKLKRATDAITQMRPYAETLQGILANLSESLDVSENDFGVQRAQKNVLLVAITSNRGLCGAFNNNIIKRCTALAKEYEAAGAKVHVLPFGKKAFDGFKNTPWLCSIEGAMSNQTDVWTELDFSKVADLGQHLMDLFVAEKSDKIVLVYNQFKNAAVQYVQAEQFLPIEEKISEDSASSSSEYIFEPSKEEIITELIPKSLKVQLYKAMLDSNASEHGARMTAMHKATDNASDLQKELKLSYNKARQAAITNEILEIVGGAEALNG